MIRTFWLEEIAKLKKEKSATNIFFPEFQNRIGPFYYSFYKMVCKLHFFSLKSRTGNNYNLLSATG